MESFRFGIEKIVYFLGIYDEYRRLRPIGTCFLTDQRGIFATSAHSVSDNPTNLAIGIIDTNMDSDISLNSYQETNVSKFSFLPVEVHKIDPLNDVCLLKGDTPHFSSLGIRDTDNVNVGERVSVFGYPHSDTGRLVLTQHTPEVGAKILLDNSGGQTKSIVLNMQSRPGQSGSPILKKMENNNFKLIGMVAGAYVPRGSGGGIDLGGVDPQTLHQTTHAISSEYLKELLDDD